MDRVRDHMSAPAVTVGLDDSVETAYDLLCSRGFHHLLVLGPAGLEGVVSDRDVLRVVSPFLDTPAERDRDRYTVRRPVHQIMTRSPVTIAADASVHEAATRMLQTGVGCLPVVDGERLGGVLTRRDLLAAIVNAAGEAAG